MLARLSSLFSDLNTHSPLFIRLLVSLGILWSSQKALSCFRFAHVYYLRRSIVHRYTTSPDGTGDAWALVTGSSDGIGKGFVEELCSRGVNVVLHGRNEEKLNRAKDDLLRRWPARQVRVLVLDAGADMDANKLDKIQGCLKDLNVRILVNNVGGNGTAEPLFCSFTNRSSSDVAQFLNINTRFPTEVTRILLPQMIQNQPSLILNIGSGLSDFPAPYVEMYSGTKAYLHAWSRSLQLEMQGEGHDIEILYLQVGGVQSNTTPRPTSFLIPSARRFAQYALETAGCGREVVWPYWPHAAQFGLVLSLPNLVRNKLILGMVKKEREGLEARNKSE